MLMSIFKYYDHYRHFATTVLLEDICEIYYKKLSTRDMELESRYMAIKYILLERTGDRKTPPKAENIKEA